MESAFTIVIVVVVVLGVLAALITFLGSGKLYDQIGRGGLSLGDDRDAAPPEPGGAAGALVREQEIRQLLEARNARRARRGAEAVDIDAELARLTTPAIDPALRAEIRDHVLASNDRRRRRGQPPLDVDSEVERRVRELGSG